MNIYRSGYPSLKTESNSANPISNMIKTNPRNRCLGWGVRLALLIIISGPASIAGSLFTYLHQPYLNQQQQHFSEVLIRDKTTAGYWFIEINMPVIKNRERAFTVLLPDDQLLQIQKITYSTGFASMLSASGKFDQSGDIILTENRQMITARIGNNQFSYMIYPLSENMHILLKLNTNLFPQDESDEGYKNMQENGKKSEVQFPEEYRTDPETGFPVQPSSQQVPDCKLRVLIAYTDDLALALADPKGFAQSCVQANNTCFANAAVNFEVELACAFEINYAESGNSSTDKTAFRNTADGVMDSVHLWRTYYDADLCHLLVNNLSNACGEAWTVAVSSYTDAFCVTSRSCAVGNLTFPHEFGHLYGARHDPYVDPNTTPYADGHGKVVFNSYRTVMAYVNECTDNGATCGRVAYFSNPSVNYLGTPTGTAGISDNESAHESSRVAISNHETTLFDKAFPAWSHNDGDYADVVALNNVSNTAAYILNSGAEVIWRAGQSHTFLPGFWAKTGSTFSTAFDSCIALNAIALEPAKIRKEISAVSNFMHVQPNPFREHFQLSIDNKEGCSLNVFIMDSKGTLIAQLKEQALIETGLQQFDIDLSGKADGIYFLVACRGSEVQSMKLLKMN